MGLLRLCSFGLFGFALSAQAASLPSTVATSSGAFRRLVSPNGAYNLVMQPDGNLVESNYVTPVWSSKTYNVGTGPFNAVMQPDGNLVVYQQNGQPGQANLATWSTNTWGQGTPPYQLTVQNDGNLVLGDATGKTIWSNKLAAATADQRLVGWESAVASSGTFTSLASPSGKYSLVMQPDGNLVEYGPGSKPLWGSSTYGQGKPPYKATMQPDGNLVVYDGTGKALWASGTYGQGNPPYSLSVNDYGNVKIYDGAQTLIWSAIGTPGTYVVGSTWTPTDPAPYRPDLSYWPDPSYLDPSVIALQEAAWKKVAKDLVAAATSGAASYSIPPGIYRTSAQIDLQNIKQPFTIEAQGVEIITEGVIPVLNLDFNKLITINGPLVIDTTSPTSTEAVVTDTDGKSFMTFKLADGSRSLESYKKGYMLMHLFDKNGVRLPMDGEFPFGIPNTPPAPNFRTLTALGSNTYRLPMASSDADMFGANEIGVGTHILIDVQYNEFFSSAHTSFALNHIRLYGGQCCQVYLGDTNTLRDFKTGRRPGTNRLGSFANAYNVGLLRGQSITFDETEIATADDDLIDVKSDPRYASPVSPQDGLPANQFYMTSVNGLWYQNLTAGFVLKFLDHQTTAQYATAVITAAADTNHSNRDGTHEVLVTLDRSVTVRPGSDIDSEDFKFLKGTVVDSYFHDGDNAGIQIKGAKQVNVTNNYVKRVISSSIYLTKDYESGYNGNVNVSNNTVDQGYYSPKNYYNFPSIKAGSVCDGSPAISGIENLTALNNRVINSAVGLALCGAAQTNQGNNAFTASPDGWKQGWVPMP